MTPYRDHLPSKTMYFWPEDNSIRQVSLYQHSTQNITTFRVGGAGVGQISCDLKLSFRNLLSSKSIPGSKISIHVLLFSLTHSCLLYPVFFFPLLLLGFNIFFPFFVHNGMPYLSGEN